MTSKRRQLLLLFYTWWWNKKWAHFFTIFFLLHEQQMMTFYFFSFSLMFILLRKISYSAGSPALSNKKKYPLFYRTCVAALSMNPLRIRLALEFDWKRVALIHETGEVFALVGDFTDCDYNIGRVRFMITKHKIWYTKVFMKLDAKSTHIFRKKKRDDFLTKPWLVEDCLSFV